jgi:hypothetical protein
MEQHPNPWKTLSTRPLYDNPWIGVREDQVINPKGGQGIYGVVHFKNKAIGIIPVDEEGYTWLVGQYRYALEEYCWEIPMGGGPLAHRRTRIGQAGTEGGNGFTAARWTMIARIHTSNSVTDEEGFVFLAEGLTPGETAPEETEDLVVRKVHLREAVAMVMDNRITDSISVGGILKAARLKGY